MRSNPIVYLTIFIIFIENMSFSEPLSKKKVFVHYMPWYASKPFSGRWGWHWTMNFYDPDEIQPNKQPKLASHYSPLIGPYDSSDPDALECHALLIKFAGIDGLIIDWYGIEDFYDYGIINMNTQHIINYAKKAGLEFAICYEDQSIKQMINAGYLNENNAVVHGQKVMAWLQEHFFESQSYLTLDDRPVLLVFGPQYFNKNQWDQLFSILPNRPFVYTLNYDQDSTDGVFGWLPVHGNTTTPEQWRKYLDELYAKNIYGKTCVGSVFPQFHDIYEDAKIHKSYGFIDAQGTKTLEETFSIALKSNCDFIQIITWNDYGEGTMIEPTAELGYSFLEKTQQILKHEYKKMLPYKAEDLRLPILLYQLRKKYQHDEDVMKDLNKCSEQLFLGNLSDARKLLELYRY